MSKSLRFPYGSLEWVIVRSELRIAPPIDSYTQTIPCSVAPKIIRFNKLEKGVVEAKFLVWLIHSDRLIGTTFHE